MMDLEKIGGAVGLKPVWCSKYSIINVKSQYGQEVTLPLLTNQVSEWKNKYCNYGSKQSKSKAPAVMEPFWEATMIKIINNSLG